MRKTYILFFLFFLGRILFVQAQCSTVTPEQNLAKYWEWRERLKNFVVPGPCMGCSMPTGNRSQSTLTYADSPHLLGYYLGMLATEYHLLNTATDTASINQQQRDIVELYYAINEVYKLDLYAKPSWNYYYNGTGGLYDTSSGNLDGFLIRDDVPAYFPDSLVNNDYIENLLDKSLSPVPDGTWYDAITVTSNWSTSQGETGKFSPFLLTNCHNENKKLGGAHVMSQDELSQLYIGLALVSKYIPLSVTYNGKILVRWAVDESNRIADNIISNGYILQNTVTNECSTGEWWNHALPGFLAFDNCKCDMGGSKFTGISEIGGAGFDAAQYAIRFNFTASQTVIDPKWRDIYPVFYINSNNEFFMCAYGTIGNVWGAQSNWVIAKIAEMDDKPSRNSSKCDLYPLLYEALWGTKVKDFTDDFYIPLLSSAPCHGVPPGGGGYYEWSGGDRILGTQGQSWSDVYFGLDYLLFFNLFEIAYPVIKGSGTYAAFYYINPKDVRESYIAKTNNTEGDEKNFWAADSVKAGNLDTTNDYIIKNNNDPNQPLFQGRAQVTFRAGHKIDMEPGFEADNGTFFDATIDTTIHVMNCVNCQSSVNLDSMYLPIDTSREIGNEINYLSIDTIKGCGCQNLLFYGINGDTAGIRSWNWNFGNGQTSSTFYGFVTYCPAQILDTNSGKYDTTYVLTLIVTDTVGNIDTLGTYLYFQGCDTHSAEHPPSQNHDSILIRTTTFNILNNLTSTSAILKYDLPEQETVTITLYNMMGLKVETIIDNAIQDRGTYSVPLGIGNLVQGMYFVTMQTNNFALTKKLIVIRR